MAPYRHGRSTPLTTRAGSRRSPANALRFFNLLESFFLRSSTCSATPSLRRVSRLGVTLRPVCLVTDVDALRDLLHLSLKKLGPATFLGRVAGPAYSCRWCSQLLWDVAISICQSCFHVDSTITPILDFFLIVQRSGGSDTVVLAAAAAPGTPGSGITGLALG